MTDWNSNGTSTTVGVRVPTLTAATVIALLMATPPCEADVFNPVDLAIFRTHFDHSSTVRPVPVDEEPPGAGAILAFADRLLSETEPFPEDFAQVVEEEFWELI